MYNKTTKTYEELSKRNRLFVDQYVRSGDRNAAYKDAGFSIAGRVWRANARKKFFEMEDIIKERVEAKIGSGAVMALNVIQTLMEDDEVSPAVRLNAAKDYLQRAGYDKPIETIVKHQSTKEDIDKELEALLGGDSAANTGADQEALAGGKSEGSLFTEGESRPRTLQ